MHMCICSVSILLHNVTGIFPANLEDLLIPSKASVWVDFWNWHKINAYFKNFKSRTFSDMLADFQVSSC